MDRLTKTEYFSKMAQLVAMRSPCLRRQIGCVLVDVHGHVMATGYNGPPRGKEHCKICMRKDLPSGGDLYSCRAIHAEQNALLQCRETMGIHTAYITHHPCAVCLRLLENTGCKVIIYNHDYPIGFTLPLTDILIEKVTND
jgi:dCMP deaminase